jgi:hypothetical protein
VLTAATASALAATSSAFAAQLCVTVKDYVDLPLPGAWVNAISLASGELRTTHTDRRGAVCFPALPEGLYSVEVGLTGFLNVRYYPVRLTYPEGAELSFRLPFGESSEGGLVQEANLSGTLRRGGSPLPGAKICLLPPEGREPFTCTLTNNLGEYAISVPPGRYKTDISILGRMVFRGTADVSGPGYYRDLLKIDEDGGAGQGCPPEAPSKK